MSRDARILVASDSVKDAELLKKMLSEEFDAVTVSTGADQVIADFERSRPEVLVLAFDTLEKSERYYLGLYRLSAMIHTLPHRALILCSKDSVKQAYALCRGERFDDYVLFWPLTYDTQRLFMAVNRALRELDSTQPGAPMMADMAAQARKIAELEALLERGLARGDTHAAAVSQCLERAETEIGAAIDAFSTRLVQDGMDGAVEVKDAASLRHEISKLKAKEVEKGFRTVNEAMRPMRQWVGGLIKEVTPHLESARALRAMAGQIRPVVLIADDDAFQCKMLAQILGAENVELIFAASGAKALAMLQKRRPDIILMDVNMPDLTGVEVTRRLKTMEQFANIPVIMITGRSEKEVVVDSLKAGAADFIVKPIDKDKLLEKLHRFIGPVDAQITT